MIIPKIWKNKKCSKPPTSQNLPANACRAMAYCCLLQVFFKAVRSSSVPHKKLFCALQRKLNETQAQNAVERFQHSCFVSPNTATRPHFLKKTLGRRTKHATHCDGEPHHRKHREQPARFPVPSAADFISPQRPALLVKISTENKQRYTAIL